MADIDQKKIGMIATTNRLSLLFITTSVAIVKCMVQPYFVFVRAILRRLDITAVFLRRGLLAMTPWRLIMSRLKSYIACMANVALIQANLMRTLNIRNQLSLMNL